jgi:hypothetical protein
MLAGLAVGGGTSPSPGLTGPESAGGASDRVGLEGPATVRAHIVRLSMPWRRSPPAELRDPEHGEHETGGEQELVPASLMREQRPHPERIRRPLAVKRIITESSAYWVRTAAP